VVAFFVVFLSAPNCPPNCRFRAQSVNLALTLATHWQAMAATHVQVVFVLFFVFLVQVSTSREVVVQLVPDDSVSPAQIESDRDELAETAAFVCE
jgi:hypothetical protein